jgi:Ran GTPase-activating protein (RanGAP) involved in mRNA processing and transport
LSEGFPSLNLLSLGGNVLTADGAKHLANALASRKVPLALSLNDNKIGDDGCTALAKLLAGTVLLELDLSGNSVGEIGAGVICAAMASNTSLTKVQLSNNPLRGAGADHVADMLRKNTSIATLGMGSCGLTDKCTQSLSDALCSNVHLTELDV